MTLRPALLVGISTRGDSPADRSASGRQTFGNVCALPKIHAMFERHGVRPTYLATWPVASDERAGEALRYLLLRGNCEVGAQHHAWETPPCSPDGPDRHRLASSLTADRFDAQLAELTAAVAGAIGERPVSYRSGAFGLGARHVSSLEREGYLVDSSVAPLFSDGRGGPDFSGAPATPYFLAYDSVVAPGSSRVLEVPCSTALERGPRGSAADGQPPPRTGLMHLLRRTGILRLQWLRPAGTTLEAMRGLARRLADGGAPVLNVLLHSHEVFAGAPDDADPAACLDRLDRFLGFAVGELGARPMTFREFHAAFTGLPRAAAQDQGG
jgi:hypothetical protein